MDDALLAGRAAAGDLDSYGQLYDRYLPRVYDFAYRTLSDPLEAAAATEDAFARTARALPAPGGAPTFRALLFEAAHAAVLTREDAPPEARTGPAPEEAFGAFQVPDPAAIDNPAVVNGDYELAALGWEALASLTARDYALLDLHGREGLTVNEVAHVLHVGKREAQQILERMTRAAENVIQTYVLARRGGCPGLRDALAPYAVPPLEDDARAAAQAHIAVCSVCQQNAKQLPPMLPVLAAFSTVAAPLELKGDAWHGIASAWRIPPATAESVIFGTESMDELERSPYQPLPAGGSGAPPMYPPPGTSDDAWSRNRVMIFAAAAIGILLFAFAGGAIIAGGFGGDGDDDNATADPTASAPGTPGAGSPGVVVETPTEDPNAPTETATATATNTPEPQVATPTLPPPPPPPTATEPPVVATATPDDGGPDATPTERGLVPIGTPSP